MCCGLARLGASLIYFLLCAHVGDGVRGGRVWGRAGRGLGGGKLAPGGCAGGLARLGRVRSTSSSACTLGDGTFPFSLFPSCGVGDYRGMQGRIPLHPDVRALQAP
jgi:hypothetical protein